MKVLILYFNPEFCTRKTIYDHLMSFERHHSEHTFFYFNLLWSFPKYLKLLSFDAIILHYSALAVRWDQDLWTKRYCLQLSNIADFNCQKIAIPQDENAHTSDLRDLFKKTGVNTVYTCAPEEEYEKLYPREKTGLEHYFTTFTGFIDEETLHSIQNQTLPHKNRKIDIGYRARNVPFWLGKHGRIKQELAELFEPSPAKDLHLDISTQEKDVFYGQNWFSFLLRCRTCLGTLGGASLLDEDGKIREKVDRYVFLHPNATFEEVEKQFFPNLDGNLKLFALSPRHFECAMTKTCQVLVEGDYGGVLTPGVHYIELKRDYSNLEAVLAQVRDVHFYSQMAERTYKDVVQSEKYTYRTFSKTVLTHIQSYLTSLSLLTKWDKLIYQWLQFRRKFETFFIYDMRFRYFIRFHLLRKIKKGLLLLQHKFKKGLFINV